MKLTIEKNTLLSAIRDLTNVVERKNTIAILSYLKVTASGDELTFEATDMDIHAIKVVKANIEIEGKLAIPAQTILDIASKINGDEVSIELDGNHLIIKSGRSRFKVAVLSSDEFPSLDSHQFDSVFEISSQEVINLINYTSFAASREELRYYLNGIYLHATERSLRSVAADGHRLAVFDVALPEGAENMPSVIVPLKTLGLWSKFAASGSTELKLFVSENKIKIQGENSMIVSKVIDGEFPDYDRIIPTDNDKNFTVVCDELKGAIDRVSVVSDPRTNNVKIECGEGKFIVTATGSDGSDAVEDILVEGDSKLTIGYNKNYIHDVLSHVCTENALVSMGNEQGATIIRDAGLGNSLYLVMPVRVN